MQRVEALRGELRVAFDPLMRCIRLAILEGPTRVAEAAEALSKSVIRANRALHPLEQSGEVLRSKDVQVVGPGQPGFRVLEQEAAATRHR